jgi:transcriptional regulator GlxA family with amidase domain
MPFLRRLRLGGVHDDRAQPNQVTTVTRAASRWGFLSFGRFAAEYQARFGEKPFQTRQAVRNAKLMRPRGVGRGLAPQLR